MDEWQGWVRWSNGEGGFGDCHRVDSVPFKHTRCGIAVGKRSFYLFCAPSGSPKRTCQQCAGVAIPSAADDIVLSVDSVLSEVLAIPRGLR